MARRHNHYESAFEDYIRSKAWPYVAVDEHRRTIFDGGRVKSFDFLVYPPEGSAWLVDIKGRKFPYDGKGGKRFWENWVTRDDLDGLRRWDGVFGAGFQAVLVFAYWLTGMPAAEPSSDIHVYRNESYAFVCVPASQYEAYARQRSAKWSTVSVPARAFRDLVTPVTARRPARALRESTVACDLL